jgi:hypothetical protein
MILYIMSRGRAGQITTINWISKNWIHKVRVVCSYGEGETYRNNHPNVTVIQAPKEVTNYSQKFQWILDGLPQPHDSGFYMDIDDRAIILDDDLVFSSKSDKSRPNSLISIKDPHRTDKMWEEIDCLLEDYALVGVHPRQMGQNAKEPYVLNGRIICMQGINRAKIGIPIKVDQFPILADVVLNCTLLSRGQANAILTTFFQDHGPCQAPGGCSLYRTGKMQQDAVQYLASRWPGFVKVIHKVNKGANWLGEEGRYDYTCQWKQLYAAGRAYVLDPGKAPNPDKEGGWPPKTMDP